MTVHELIQALKELPQGAIVCWHDGEFDSDHLDLWREVRSVSERKDWPSVRVKIPGHDSEYEENFVMLGSS